MKPKEKLRVAVIGASNKPERYAYQAFQLLREKGHQVYPVHPRLEEINGVRVYKCVGDIPDEIHTVTLYVGGKILQKLVPELMTLSMKRIIFNPGTENDALEKCFQTTGVEVVRGCTLVMLKTNQF